MAIAQCSFLAQDTAPRYRDRHEKGRNHRKSCNHDQFSCVIVRPEWHLLPLKLHQPLFLTAWRVFSRREHVAQCQNPLQRRYQSSGNFARLSAILQNGFVGCIWLGLWNAFQSFPNVMAIQSRNEPSIGVLAMFPFLVVRDCSSPLSMILCNAVESIQEYNGDCSVWRLIAMSISLAGVESVKCACRAISATIAVGVATALRKVFDKQPDDASADASSLDAGAGVARTALAARGTVVTATVASDEGCTAAPVAVGCTIGLP